MTFLSPSFIVSNKSLAAEHLQLTALVLNFLFALVVTSHILQSNADRLDNVSLSRQLHWEINIRAASLSSHESSLYLCLFWHTLLTTLSIMKYRKGAKVTGVGWRGVTTKRNHTKTSVPPTTIQPTCDCMKKKRTRSGYNGDDIQLLRHCSSFLPRLLLPFHYSIL